ncbi:MAG: DUF3540 domain-containing protein [Sandaracinaceae bacterium]|nr:DUF3540 domain-containing protein [Sandaracinaceae bacterium]
MRAVAGEALAVRVGARTLAARGALPGYAPREGDEVVLAVDAREDAYVIGALAPPLVEITRDAPDEATVRAGPGCGRLRVLDEAGRLLFEHRDGVSVVSAPSGALTFAADAIRLRGRAVEVDAQELTVRAARARSELDEAELVAGTWTSVAQSVLHTAETLEVRAHQLVERARNVYRDTEELAQTRAGRVRVLAESTFHLFARRAQLGVDEDLKLKGDKIHLG